MSDRPSRILRRRRLFMSAPSVMAVLVLMGGSVLPPSASSPHPDPAGAAAVAGVVPTLPVEPPASVTEVPQRAVAPPAPAGRNAEARRTLPAPSPWSAPDVLLDAYRQAVADSPPACHLPVGLLAAIGQVESGSLSGRSLDSAHRAVPPVLGPVLDGVGTAAIADTDDGRLDGDSRWDRAVGPMQFIPGTWAAFGVDANGDGTADPQNVYDAAGAAAGYLCDRGRNLSSASDLRAAILTYNHSTAYLATVLAWQQRFTASDGGGSLPVSDGPGAGPTGPTTPSPGARGDNRPSPRTPGPPRIAGNPRPPAIPGAPSSPVIVLSATRLAFSTAPSATTTSGTAWAAQPVVTVQDSGGKTVTTDTSAVTLTLTTPDGANLACATNRVAATSGIARFTGCTIDRAGTYTLTATDGSLTPATSTSVTVAAGPAARLGFTSAPSPTATSGAALAAQPVVTVQDAAGNTVTTDHRSVTLALTTVAGASLTCAQNPTAATSGVAVFTGCRIDKSGTYTLTATDGWLSPATSSSVTILAGAPALVTVVSGSAQSTTVNTEVTNPLVAEVTDANGNPVPGAAVTFTAPDHGASGTFANTTATTTTFTDLGGRASSGVVTANTTAGSYHLTATTGPATATFTLTSSAAAAARLLFTSEPVSGPVAPTATLGPITVQIQDLYGNPAPAPTTGIEVTLSSDSVGTTVFATALAGASVTSLIIPGGESGATFYYGDNQPGSPQITVSGPLTSAIQEETITLSTAVETAPLP